MTVAELRAKLDELPDDAVVLVSRYNHGDGGIFEPDLEQMAVVWNPGWETYQRAAGEPGQRPALVIR